MRKEQNIVKFCSWTLKLPPLAHFLINFALYWKTYDLLQGFFKCGSRVVHNLFN